MHRFSQIKSLTSLTPVLVIAALCTNMPPETMLPFAATVAAAGCKELGARTGLPHWTDPCLASFLEQPSNSVKSNGESHVTVTSSSSRHGIDIWFIICVWRRRCNQCRHFCFGGYQGTVHRKSYTLFMECNQVLNFYCSKKKKVLNF